MFDLIRQFDLAWFNFGPRRLMCQNLKVFHQSISAISHSQVWDLCEVKVAIDYHNPIGLSLVEVNDCCITWVKNNNLKTKQTKNNRPFGLYDYLNCFLFLIVHNWPSNMHLQAGYCKRRLNMKCILSGCRMFLFFKYCFKLKMYECGCNQSDKAQPSNAWVVPVESVSQPASLSVCQSSRSWPKPGEKKEYAICTL